MKLKKKPQKLTPFGSISNRFRDMSNSLNSQYSGVVKITLLYPVSKKSNLQNNDDFFNFCAESLYFIPKLRYNADPYSLL